MHTKTTCPETGNSAKQAPREILPHFVRWSRRARWAKMRMLFSRRRPSTSFTSSKRIPPPPLRTPVKPVQKRLSTRLRNFSPHFQQIHSCPVHQWYGAYFVRRPLLRRASAHYLLNGRCRYFARSLSGDPLKKVNFLKKSFHACGSPRSPLSMSANSCVFEEIAPAFVNPPKKDCTKRTQRAIFHTGAQTCQIVLGGLRAPTSQNKKTNSRPAQSTKCANVRRARRRESHN